ncbi:MAG: hypothetical protein AB7O97_01120 [Planctomycetota bacterium]
MPAVVARAFVRVPWWRRHALQAIACAFLVGLAVGWVLSSPTT